MLFGGLSGGLGPLVNNPLDVVKTRLQKQRIVEGQTPKYTGIAQAIPVIAREEGVTALWKVGRWVDGWVVCPLFPSPPSFSL